MMAVVSLRRKSSSEWAASGPTAVFRLHSLVPQMRREIRRLTGKSAHSHLVFILLYEMECSGYFTGLTWHTNTLSPMSKEDQIAALLTHHSYSSHSLYSDCTPAWKPRKLHVAWQTYSWKQNNKTIMSLLHVCIVTVWTCERLISVVTAAPSCVQTLNSTFGFCLHQVFPPEVFSWGSSPDRQGDQGLHVCCWWWQRRPNWSRWWEHPWLLDIPTLFNTHSTFYIFLFVSHSGDSLAIV